MRLLFVFLIFSVVSAEAKVKCSPRVEKKTLNALKKSELVLVWGVSPKFKCGHRPDEACADAFEAIQNYQAKHKEAKVIRLEVKKWSQYFRLAEKDLDRYAVLILRKNEKALLHRGPVLDEATAKPVEIQMCSN